ncbi:alpha/beta hydrolase [Halostreptopolyspora alba]|uniref:alpha/beta hydrolase n=1 Tax=Halostreptopolyspora alba TaxID=2487137 RepID=UPI0026AC5E60
MSPELAGSWPLLLRIAVVAVALLVVLGGLLWGFQRRFIYLPDDDPVPPAAERIEGARDLTLRTEDGLELGAWFVPPRGDDRELAVLVANGNAGNRASRAPTATALADEGFSVLLFDYRGYGRNPGSPSEEGLARDARAARATLEGELGFAPERTIYFGESIGTGVVTRLAVDHPPAGLVLRSPFTDLAHAGRHHYPFIPLDLVLWDRFPIAEQVRGMAVPTTVIYGDSDTIIPPGESRRVAEAAGALFEEVVVSGADHNDPEMFDGPRVVSAVARLGDEIAPD